MTFDSQPFALKNKQVLHILMHYHFRWPAPPQVMSAMNELKQHVLRTLLYYDIWSHPLTEDEVFAFLPINSMTREEFRATLRRDAVGDPVFEHGGYYFVRGKTEAIVQRRQRAERHARYMWRMARLSMHVIKRFPFVRGVFVSGDLSKNVTNPKSDVDFLIITEPGRLWIARTLLILFKKVFLLNRKKFFCLNYFLSSDSLTLREHNIYAATEIAHLKPLSNSALFHQFLKDNDWIEEFFPNFHSGCLQFPPVNERSSALQTILEFPFRFLPSDRIDEYLMRKMKAVWRQRYPELDELTRERIFRSTRTESRAYVGDFETKILAIYHQKLQEFGIAP